MNIESKQIICPHCGWEQTYIDECIKCGVIISKYVAIQKKRKSVEENKLNGHINLKMENTSGQGKTSTVPSGIKGWNWGAFFLNFIWAVGNRTWIGLLTIVPLVGYVIPIILGLKGNEWAWKNKKWKDIDHFKSVQKKWAIWGACLIIPLFVSFVSFLFYSAWWLDSTGKIFGPTRNYVLHFGYQARLVVDQCSPEAGSFLDCLREYSDPSYYGTENIYPMRGFFTPPEEIKHLGFLVANDLKLFNDDIGPLFVCMTPIHDIRVVEGEPSGKNHLAVFYNDALRKLPPEEYQSLDKSLYIDVSAVVQVLDSLPRNAN